MPLDPDRDLVRPLRVALARLKVSQASALTMRVDAVSQAQIDAIAAIAALDTRRGPMREAVAIATVVGGVIGMASMTFAARHAPVADEGQLLAAFIFAGGGIVGGGVAAFVRLRDWLAEREKAARAARVLAEREAARRGPYR